MRRLAFALMFALAGCGGAAVPAAHDPASSAVLRTVEGSNRGFESGSLWMGSSVSALAYDLAGPQALPFRVIGSIGNERRPDGGSADAVDMTIAPDGTVYELVDVCRGTPSCAEDSAYSWKLKIYAPGASGYAAVEQLIEGAGRGRSVALNNNVIDVLSSDGTTAAPHGYVASYRYAAGDDPAPVRTLTLAYAPRYFGLDLNGLIYVASGASIKVYPAKSSGAAGSPVRTISLPSALDDSFALGTSGRVYVPLHAFSPQTGSTTTIDVYGPGHNGPAPGNTIVVDLQTFGIAVDANENVWVGIPYIGVRMYALKTGSTVVRHFEGPDFDPTNPPERPFLNELVAIGPPPPPVTTR